MITILFLSANPRDQDPASIEKECNEIKKQIGLPYVEDHIKFHEWHGISSKDFLTVIDDYKPNILHFSGHATKNKGDPVFLDENDQSERVRKQWVQLAAKTANGNIKFVVLSACYSLQRSKEYVKYVDAVIGTHYSIKDDEARIFFAGFYRKASKEGSSLNDAYNFGIDELKVNKKRTYTKSSQGAKLRLIDYKTRRGLDANKLLFFDTREEEQANLLRDYLTYVSKPENLQQREQISSIDNKVKTIKDYYVLNQAIPLDVSTEWYLTDEESRIHPVKENFLKQTIEDFIKNEKLPYLVIGATFGMGKTTLIKFLCSEYAQNCLNDEDSFSYIPIPIFLRNGLSVEYDGGHNLDYVMSKIVPRPNDTKTKEKNRILLLLDGLDEYDGPRIADEIDSYRIKGYKIKTIFTTRLEEKVLDSQGIIGVKTYVRLLPFSEPQLNVFFENYQVKVDQNRRYLTCQYARELDLPVEIMTKPLFAFMYSFVHVHSNKKLRIEQKEHWSPNMTKAWIYFQFFHNIIEASQKKIHKTDSWKRVFFAEKKGLRIAAALKQMHTHYEREDLSLDDIKKESEDIEKDNAAVDTGIISKSYFIYINSSRGKQLLNFVHKSFMEYLLAEYYLETSLNQNVHKLNIGMPSKITIDFLDGLIGLLNSSNHYVDKFISSNETSLLASFNYMEHLKKAKKEMIDNLLYFIKNEYIIFYKTHDAIRDSSWVIVPIKEIKVESQLKSGFIQLWIHRWVSVVILNKLLSVGSKKNDRDKIYKAKDFKSNITSLISFSSDSVPSYLKKFESFDLSGEDLSQANLFRADLSGANLSKANLFRADLSEGNISDTNFVEANLDQASLSRANLFDAKFSYANLSEAKFSYANLSYANLSKANLSKANLSYANLSDANLSFAVLSNTDLSYTNLSDAYLSYTHIRNCNNYANLICYGTDLESAYLNDKKLLTYLRSNNAVNVPKKISKRTRFRSEKSIRLEVIDRVPAINAKDVPIYQVLAIKFNKLLEMSSINSSTVKLVEILHDRCTILPGVVSLMSSDSKTIVFVATHALKPNTGYMLRISSEVKDLSGNNIEHGVSWSFKTMNTKRIENLPIFGIAASGDDGNIALNIIDNNLNTRWSCPGIGSWIKLDLGEKKTIYNIEIGWFKGNRRKYNYRIQVAPVNQDKQFKQISKKSSQGNTLLPEDNSYRTKPISARYVKIIVDGNDMNNWASITEVDIYGTS